MESYDIYHYDKTCYKMYKVSGVRFAAIINKRGRKIAGGFNRKVTPLENDEKKLEMLFMQLTLDLTMRNEFNNSLGKMNAVVSFRDRTNIITIPHGDHFMLVSVEPEIDTLKVIETAYNCLESTELMEVIAH